MNKFISTPIVALTASLFVSAANAGDRPVTFGGFFSNGYLESSNYNYLADTEGGTFDFAEMGINATWSPIERTTVTGQLFAFELGDYGNYDPIIDYLFVDYYVNQYFGVRAGRVKKPNGIYNEIQDIDVARTAILLPMGMYDQRYRDFSASVDGLSLYGSLPFGNFQSIDYNIYHGGIDLSPDGGHGAALQTQVKRLPHIQDGLITDLSSDTNTGIQLWWNTPVSGLRLGGAYSYYDGVTIDLEAKVLSRFGPLPYYSYSEMDLYTTKASAEYFYNQWTFTSEFESWKSETHIDSYVAGIQQPRRNTAKTSETYYVSASRRFLEKYHAGITYSNWKEDKTISNSDPANVAKDWQFSFRYDATQYWTLKAEYHDVKGTNRLFDQNNQNPVIDEESWTLIALKSTFTF